MVHQADSRVHRPTAVLVLCYYLHGVRHRLKSVMRFVAGVIPVVVMVNSGLMCVRGYVPDEQASRVKQLIWHTPIALSQLNSTEYNPGVAEDLTRTWGNGGIYDYVIDFTTIPSAASKPTLPTGTTRRCCI